MSGGVHRFSSTGPSIFWPKTILKVLVTCSASLRGACKERSFGRFRGEIARDCFALELADQRLIHNNHEVYFREMLRGDIFETTDMPRIEDVARQLFSYF